MPKITLEKTEDLIERSHRPREKVWRLAVVAMVAILMLGILWQWRVVSNFISPLPEKSEAQPGDTNTEHKSVGALGRLEPLGQISRVALPAFLKDERVASVLVKEGDWVKAGQIICRMDAQQRLLRELDLARREVQLSAARLERVKAGAKEGEIGASQAAVLALRAEQSNKLVGQDATISKARAELAFQENECERYRRLQQAGAVSISQYDSKRTALKSAQANRDEELAERKRIAESMKARIDEAEANVRRIKEVRSVDVAIAEAELKQAEAKRDKVLTDLRLSEVTSPRDGRILKLNVRPGETVTEKGILELGSTSQMVAVTEVYQSDVGKLRVGQKAIIRGDGISSSIRGHVRSIGWEVSRQSIYAQDPSTGSDARVVEVKVLIDDSDNAIVEKLSNMQVEVVFLRDDSKASRQTHESTR